MRAMQRALTRLAGARQRRWRALAPPRADAARPPSPRREVNARTTMSHYAAAAFARLGGGEYSRFEVLRAADVRLGRDGVVCLTDPETAEAFCAVLRR